MEQVPEELSQVRVVRLVIKTQRTAEIQVRGKLGCKTRNSELTRSSRTGMTSPPTTPSSLRGGTGSLNTGPGAGRRRWER